ncbi:MAG: LysR family transcriptional regulator [Deltaproteobacteria bacterium]|nr:LysR family transcriptional regulator [Deltaproteobacteria bacterium]
MERYLKNITIQQMRSLVCLAEERSFSRAAKKMYLTQPSLTKHIKNLEEETGVQLVDRKSRGISLTPEGRILCESARRVFGLIDDTGEKIARMKDNESGSISIAASTIPATYILPHSLSKFRDGHKNIRCYVRTNDSDLTLDMILNDEAEIGFIGREIAGRKLRAESLWRDRLVLVVPASHKWSGRGKVSLNEVSTEPFVSRERGSATRKVLEEYLRKNTNLALSGFNIVCELGSSEAVKEAILAGLGVSIISIHAVGREIESGLLLEIPVENCSIERNFYMIYKARVGLMKHHRIFLDFIRNYELDARHGK